MSKPFTNPFFEADMSQLFNFNKIGGLGLPQWDMEAAASVQRKNIEACTALSQAAFETFQSLWRRQADMARQMMEESAQTMQSIMATQSPEEKVIKQAEASKAAMEKCVANLRDIAETVAKCNTQALDTVSTRVSEGISELRGIVSKNVRAA